jgi:hypothetical protein
MSKVPCLVFSLESLRQRVAIALATVSVVPLLSIDSAIATEQYPITSKGPLGTIVARAKIDTDAAVVVAMIKAHNALEFCKRDPGGITVRYGGRLTLTQCVKQVIQEEGGKKYYARANCRLRTVNDHWGGTYSLASKRWSGSYWEYTWRDKSNGLLLDGSNASGAPIISDLYKLLCPSTS